MQAAALIDRLEPVIDDLDRLMADLRLGVRSPQQYDALEERAQHIASQIRGAFRSRR